MKRQLCHILVMLLAVTLLPAATSCRSKKDNIIYYKSDKDKGKKDKEAKQQDARWATLDVKLDRNDNKALYTELKTWLGVPYRYGGHSRRGTDCSGMVMEVYQAVYGLKLQRNSAKMFERDCREIQKKDLREGDLVFFATGGGNRISHVGIYLKDGHFVHASSSRGVVVNHLDERYYTRHWRCAGRVKH